MTSNDSVDFVLRLIKQKHQDLKKSLPQMLRVLAGEDAKLKKSTAELMLTSANDLRAILAHADRPSWLENLITQLTEFTAGRWNSYDFLSNFIPQKHEIENHQWVFEKNSETPFDFDAIFAHYKKDSRLPELFDEIVLLLEEIHGSGSIDSISMLGALEKVIFTIKKNKDGSYFSLNSTWDFLLSFLKNYMWGELSKLPVLGTAMEALEKTIDQTNEEMFRVHTQVSTELKRVVEEEVKALANKTSFPFVTYDQSGHLLSNSSLSKLPHTGS